MNPSDKWTYLDKSAYLEAEPAVKYKQIKAKCNIIGAITNSPSISSGNESESESESEKFIR